jgi:hypothetical protein
MSARTLALCVAAVVVAIVSVRQVSIGRNEDAAAEAAMFRSDWPEAIAHALATAEACVPGSPWPERGRLRLEAIGRDAEARSDQRTALLAYGALRTAALATRNPLSWLMNDRWRKKADNAIARAAASRGEMNTPRISPELMLHELDDTQSPGPWTYSLLTAASLMILGALAHLAGPTLGARGARAIALFGFATYAIVLLTR